MWRAFFNKNEVESINKYQQSPFDQDFYKHLITTSQTLTSRLENYYTSHTFSIDDNINKQRQKLKKDMMLILFDDNPNHRNNAENIIMFKRVFPGVEKWIRQAHDIIDKSRFSYLLQRCESYLLLNVVCREFHEQFPHAPIITIHDAICTHAEYLPDLKQLLLGRFNDITGIRVGVKTKSEKSNPEPKPEDINEEWDEIRPIKTFEKYQEAHGGVFSPYA